MSRQGRLFESDDVLPLVGEDDARLRTILEQAERFHRLNPHIYRLAVAIARFIKSRGLSHYGIGALWEILRFKYIETSGDVYKLNNNYRAYYARLIMAQEPDLAGFFSTRDCPNDADYHTREVRS